ncbi:MAG: hypothetical protein WDN25_18030 [Acetobacteraceae bacterium]
MRKFLLASVATLGATGGLMNAALAQAPAPRGAPSQGQMAYPLANPTAYVNNNNNYQAAALPGALPNPTPGTIVVHINGKVQTEVQAAWTNFDTRLAAAPAAGSAAAILGNNGTGVVKLQPVALNEFARLYFGADGMATNGLRYGAAIEVRQNFTGQLSSNANDGASGYTSLQTLYVRRAFTYAAGDQWGLFRLGVTDGIIGIFDNGVTTGQFSFIGELNGGDTQNMPGPVPPFWFLGQAGAEYGNVKAVYLSPQIAGFDFGLQYAPNTSNGFGLSTGQALNGSLTGAGTGTGTGCGVANSGCPTLSSGPGIQDGARAIHQTALGVRYQGKFGDVGVLAYGVYEFSGHANYTGLTTPAILGTATVPGSSFNGSYDGLSFGSGGLAVTYAGFTLAGNLIGGRLNGQLALAPKGGVGELAYTVSAKYVTGPFTVGVVGEIGWYQGNPVLSGISQRRGRGIAAGVQYNVAPGFSVGAEYLWNDIQQSANNLVSNAVGTAAGSNLNNNFHGQMFMIGNVVNF